MSTPPEPALTVSDACDLAAAAVACVLDTDALEAARAAGVAEERERCAQLADYYQVQVDVYDPDDDVIGPEWLADLIRSGAA